MGDTNAAHESVALHNELFHCERALPLALCVRSGGYVFVTPSPDIALRPHPFLIHYALLRWLHSDRLRDFGLTPDLFTVVTVTCRVLGESNQADGIKPNPRWCLLQNVPWG